VSTFSAGSACSQSLNHNSGRLRGTWLRDIDRPMCKREEGTRWLWVPLVYSSIHGPLESGALICCRFVRRLFNVFVTSWSVFRALAHCVCHSCPSTELGSLATSAVSVPLGMGSGTSPYVINRLPIVFCYRIAWITCKTLRRAATSSHLPRPIDASI
jgi:hypothetical protein